jgi:maltose/moltooligosaccharide transporter
MWLFFVPATARHVFGATDPQSALYTQGMEWGGFVFAFYSITCFVVALALPGSPRRRAARRCTRGARVRRRRAALGVRHPRPVPALLSMVGVGIAWASILSMPYAILSGALPPARMGVYMGVFNFFIVIPEIVAALGFGPLTRALFGEDNPNAPLYVVMIGGACLLAAAALRHARARRGRARRARRRGDRRRRARAAHGAGQRAAGAEQRVGHTLQIRTASASDVSGSRVGMNSCAT